jgi:hypothetical protein
MELLTNDLREKEKQSDHVKRFVERLWARLAILRFGSIHKKLPVNMKGNKNGNHHKKWN